MNKTLLYSVAVVALVSLVPSAQAETVTTKTYVQPQELPNVNEVNFRAFDVNNDGSYSMSEVGERLFESFDRDHNGLIDNREWDQRAVMTITPVEKETFKYIDYDDDGLTDSASYTYQTFYQASGLIKFDDNLDGLSARDFVKADIQALDENEDNMIDMKEWKQAYLTSRPEHEKQESYN